MYFQLWRKNIFSYKKNRIIASNNRVWDPRNVYLLMLDVSFSREQNVNYFPEYQSGVSPQCKTNEGDIDLSEEERDFSANFILLKCHFDENEY